MNIRPPQERLEPGSWTEADVDAIEGHRVRFRSGGGGTIRDAVGLVNDQNEIYLYAVHVTPDSGPTILLSKGDAASGDWAFNVLVERVTEEERQALPAWRG